MPRAILATRIEFEQAVAPLLPRLYRFCLSLSDSEADAEDLLADGLVRAYVHRESYEARGSLDGWLYQVLRREHEERVRTLARRRSLLQTAITRVGDVLSGWMGAAPPEPEAWAIAEQEAADLLEALRNVPEPYRLVVLLCDIEELSYEEAAERLGIPVGTVKSRHARGRERLRDIFMNRPARKEGGHG